MPTVNMPNFKKIGAGEVQTGCFVCCISLIKMIPKSAESYISCDLCVKNKSSGLKKSSVIQKIVMLLSKNMFCEKRVIKKKMTGKRALTFKRY